MIAVYKGCLLGRVCEVYPWFSKLELITDKSCKIAAHGLLSKASGIYQGTNSESLAQLNHVSHLAMLQDNDVLISSGEGLVFPRGFGLGKIKRFHVDGLFFYLMFSRLLMCVLFRIATLYNAKQTVILNLLGYQTAITSF